jgi:hypothetical protein
MFANKFILIAFSLILLTACSDDENKPSGKGDIYLVGSINKDATSVAAYWKNSKMIELTTTSQYAGAYDISVEKNNVYVCGMLRKGNAFVAHYWKNGVVSALTTDDTYHSYATAMVVDGDIVHIAGYKYSSTTAYKAYYWKVSGNTITEKVLTSNESSNSVANDIVLSNKKIYIVGYERSMVRTLQHIGN